jgi:hypothetical protein
MDKKFINIFNKHANKTANQLSDSDCFEVVRAITKNRSLSPAEKWSMISDFTQNSMTVGNIYSLLKEVD